MEEHIDLILVSGFLGSGKTTFLRRFLTELPEQRLGVLVNEFGAVGIDGTLLRRDGLEMVELNHGSIFCSCLKQDFVTALIAFSRLPIQTLIIENSGMADPGGMELILEQLSGQLERPYSYRGLICLADCLTLPDYVDVLVPLQNQLKAADFILINKTDLVSREQVREVHEIVRRYNGHAECYDTVCGEISLPYLMDHLVHHGYRPPPGMCCCNTVESRPANYVLEADGVYRPEGLEQFCQTLGRSTLRIKGFAPGADGGIFQVDAVGPQVEVRPADPETELTFSSTRLVIIGKTSFDLREEIENAWERYCRGLCNIEAT